MADLHHGAFSYSIWPTPQDLLPKSQHSKIPSSLYGKSSALEKFDQFITLFKDALKSPSNPPVEGADEESGLGLKISASRARDAALPSVCFSPVHALALELEPFEEEPLKGIAFGNISPDNYIDLFWDIVQTQSEESWGQLVVYEAEQSSEPRFLVCFQDQLFEFRYIRCDVLVREYPKVSNAPGSFLQDPQNRVPQTVQDVVKMIQRGSDIHKNLDRFPSLRTAYSYIKKWASIRGVSENLPSNQIFKILQEYQKSNPSLISPGQAGDPSSSALIRQFFAQEAIRFDRSFTLPSDWETFDAENWNTVLVNANSQPLDRYSIRVQVTYSGVSPMKGAQWILMVQRKLTKLKERLERTIPGRPPVTIWPQRLVEISATPSDDVYEGSFILALGLREESKKADMVLAQDASALWKEQVEKDRSTLEDQCFIRISFNNLPEFKPCTRKWPRIVLTGENTLDPDSHSENAFPKGRNPIRRSKGSIANENGKAERFRTAAEVLNRLKFDKEYNIDEFVIGYMDRIKQKIIEKQAADWDRDVSAEDFVPEHRIEYFKRYEGVGGERGEILWDRKAKVDKIFKHG